MVAFTKRKKQRKCIDLIQSQYFGMSFPKGIQQFKSLDTPYDKEFYLLGFNAVQSDRSPKEITEEYTASIFKGQRASQARNRCQLLAGYLIGLFFGPENGGSTFLPKCWRIFTGLHGVTSQKIVLYIVTAERTSNPTSHRRCLYVIRGWA
jgi:hypothetical protein